MGWDGEWLKAFSLAGKQYQDQMQFSNMEELSAALFSNYSFKLFLRQQLEDQRPQVTSEIRPEIECIVEDISKYLLEHTETTLNEKHNRQYQELLEQTKQLYLEQTDKFQLQLQESVAQLRKSVNESLECFKTQLQRDEQTTGLLAERSQLYRSIRGVDKCNLFKSKENLNLNQSTASSFELPQHSRTVCKLQIPTVESKYDLDFDFEASGKKKAPTNELNDLHIKVDVLDREHQKMLSKQIRLETDIDDKLTSGLEGIWNVIGDLEEKFNRVSQKRAK